MRSRYSLACLLTERGNNVSRTREPSASDAALQKQRQRTLQASHATRVGVRVGSGIGARENSKVTVIVGYELVRVTSFRQHEADHL